MRATHPFEDAFPYLTEDERGLLLRRSRAQEYAAGDVIVEEDSVLTALFVVAEGQVVVEKSHLGGRIPITDLGAGALFGEVSFLDGSPASASVAARTPVKVLVLEQIDDLLSAEPTLARGFYRSLAVLLARRLRYTTDDRIVSALQWG